jgi:hypothetical protein
VLPVRGCEPGAVTAAFTDDWLPEKHLARFLVDVVDALDLGAIYDSYEEKDGRGQAGYDPAMMVRVLLYGYCTGSYSDALFKLGHLIDLRLTARERLISRRIQPEQVTDIILTHLDNDHAGGLHDFPDATIHVSKEELNSYDSARPRGPYKRYQISHNTKFKTYERTDERWFDLEVRSLQLPLELEAKLVPLPGHTLGHCGVAYREDGRWSLHAGDAYFDAKVNFEEHAPALPIEIAFQTDASVARQVSDCSRLCDLCEDPK